MPRASNISAPQSGSESFFQGAGVMNQLLSAIANRRAQQQKIKQAQQMMPYQQALDQASARYRNEQVASSQFQRDPQKQVNFIRQIIGSLGGQGGGQPSAVPQQNMMAALSSMTPEKRNIARALIKRSTGIDPLARVWETPEQLAALKEQTQENVEQKKADIKATQDILKGVNAINQKAEYAQTVGQILDKHPDLTGRVNAAKDYLNALGDSDFGSLKSAAGGLQAMTAREFGNRGGAVVAQLASSLKPSVSKSYAFNRGATNEIINRIKSAHKRFNDQYKQVTGKDLPKGYELPDYIKNYKPVEVHSTTIPAGKSQDSAPAGEKMVTYIDPDGGRHTVPLSVANRLQGGG